MHPVDLLIQQADIFLSLNGHKDGAVAGLNGPHLDPETHFRNSAHWLALLSRLNVLTGRGVYRDAANDLANFLISDSSLSVGMLPAMRIKAGKDAANGVIGAAWIMEGLLVGAQALQRPDLGEVAAGLSSWFPFSRKQNLWVTKEPDGTVLDVDTTLNHQIWFGMACSMLPSASVNENNLQSFIVGLKNHLRCNQTGAISHLVKNPTLSKANIISAAVDLFDADGIISRFKYPNNKITKKLFYLNKLHKEKELGYIIFTMHGLSRLIANRSSSHLLKKFEEQSYNSMLKLISKREFEVNKWSYGYNPPGFEFPLLAETMNRQADISSYGARIYATQLEKTYDDKTKSFSKGNLDPATMTARLYSLALCNIETLQLLGKSIR